MTYGSEADVSHKAELIPPSYDKIIEENFIISLRGGIFNETMIYATVRERKSYGRIAPQNYSSTQDE